MQLVMELGIELVAYVGTRRVLLDSLTVENVRDRLVNEQHWRHAIAHVVALSRFNVQRIPLDEAILAASESGLIQHPSRMYVIPRLRERTLGE
jgi:hypothetical protein